VLHSDGAEKRNVNVKRPADILAILDTWSIRLIGAMKPQDRTTNLRGLRFPTAV
jgi:hypothetical protein